MRREEKNVVMDVHGVGDDKERKIKTEGCTVSILLEKEGTIDRAKRRKTGMFRRDCSTSTSQKSWKRAGK